MGKCHQPNFNRRNLRYYDLILSSGSTDHLVHVILTLRKDVPLISSKKRHACTQVVHFAYTATASFMTINIISVSYEYNFKLILFTNSRFYYSNVSIKLQDNGIETIHIDQHPA